MAATRHFPPLRDETRGHHDHAGDGRNGIGWQQHRASSVWKWAERSACLPAREPIRARWPDWTSKSLTATSAIAAVGRAGRPREPVASCMPRPACISVGPAWPQALRGQRRRHSQRRRRCPRRSNHAWSTFPAWTRSACRRPDASAMKGPSRPAEFSALMWSPSAKPNR